MPLDELILGTVIGGMLAVLVGYATRQEAAIRRLRRDLADETQQRILDRVAARAALKRVVRQLGQSTRVDWDCDPADQTDTLSN